MATEMEYITDYPHIISTVKERLMSLSNLLRLLTTANINPASSSGLRADEILDSDAIFSSREISQVRIVLRRQEHLPHISKILDGGNASLYRSYNGHRRIRAVLAGCGR